VLELAASIGSAATVKTVGLPTAFIEQGPRSLLLDNLGLSEQRLAETARQFFKG
jgi:deoxyxylulose-5-phosphate synthase